MPTQVLRANTLFHISTNHHQKWLVSSKKILCAMVWREVGISWSWCLVATCKYCCTALFSLLLLVAVCYKKKTSPDGVSLKLLLKWPTFSFLLSIVKGGCRWRSQSLIQLQTVAPGNASARLDHRRLWLGQARTRSALQRPGGKSFSMSLYGTGRKLKSEWL